MAAYAASSVRAPSGKRHVDALHQQLNGKGDLSHVDDQGDEGGGLAGDQQQADGIKHVAQVCYGLVTRNK